jgi:hypothetical protein
MNKCQELNRSVEALAALGAELRLRQKGPGSDSRVPSQEQNSCRNIGLSFRHGAWPVFADVESKMWTDIWFN